MEVRDVFADLEARAWPYMFEVGLHTPFICGGVPSDPDVAAGWLAAKLQPADEEQLRLLVAQTMVDRNIDYDTAVAEVNKLKHLNGFCRDSELGIWIAGRQLKAAFKEAVSVAVAAPKDPSDPSAKKKLEIRGWGDTNKYLTRYIPEHVFVAEDRIYLQHASDDPEGRWKEGDPFHEPSRVIQSFPMNARINQTGIQRTEVCDDVVVNATIKTDHPFTRAEFGIIWLTGGQQGLGAQRSQSYGRYTVVKWNQIRGNPVPDSAGHKVKAPRKGRAAAAVPDDDGLDD